MLPGFVIDDIADVLPCHTKSVRDRLVCLTSLDGGADFANVGFCELCAGATFTPTIRSMEDLVETILPWRAPLEIRQTIVGRIAIREVSAFHACWAWSDKSFKNEVVNPSWVCFAVTAKVDIQVAAMKPAWFQLLPGQANKPSRATGMSSVGPNGTVVSHAVAGEAWNLAVLNRCARIVRHGASAKVPLQERRSGP
jgi:hypothetical protein